MLDDILGASGENMKTYQKLEWIHFAIQEAMNDNLDELSKALEFVEEVREVELSK